jgi:hypothetical protein
VAHFGGALAAWFEVFDQRHIGAGAAHVEREDIADTGIAPHPDRPGHPAGRAGHQDADRVLLGLLRAHQPAVGAQQRKLAGHPSAARRLRKLETYLPTTGRTLALATVVRVRSYSAFPAALHG